MDMQDMRRERIETYCSDQGRKVLFDGYSMKCTECCQLPCPYNPTPSASLSDYEAKGGVHA